MHFVENCELSHLLVHTKNLARYFTYVVLCFMTEFRQVQSQKLHGGQDRGSVHQEETLKACLPSVLARSDIFSPGPLPTGPSDV